MFLKKITSIYLILSLLQFLHGSAQISGEETGGTFIQTPTFSNYNPMTVDMSDPIIKELTKHYNDLISRNPQQQQQQNQADDDQKPEFQEMVANSQMSPQQPTEMPLGQATATETPVEEQQPLKIDIPAQLDELNETDDIETSRKFYITTIIPELKFTSNQNQSSAPSTDGINERIDFKSVFSSIETRENAQPFESSDNETDLMAETNDEQNFTDREESVYRMLSDDTADAVGEYDSKPLSPAMLISTELNDTAEIANEMKHNILYTEEIDENNLLRVYNHSMDSAENLMDEYQPRNMDAAAEPEAAAQSSDDNNAGEIELLDGPEMLIATTTMPPPPLPQSTTLPPIVQSLQRNKQQSKQGKQIIHHQLIEEKSLLPHEKLRNFIEDPYSRSPIAAIIDPSQNVLERARILWKNALRPNTGLDIILLAMVNKTALPLIYHLDNTRTFLAGLNSMKESTNADPFSGVLKATELIPYDSAVFICVEAVEPNPELANYAGILLLKKRIKLYLIWFGDRKSKDSNEPVGGMLGKIALRSGGEIIYMDEMNHIEGSSNDLEDNMITLISDSFRGTQEIDIPIDTTTSSIQMKIDSQMRTATLETPTGDSINLMKLMHLKSKKFIGSTKIYYEINLPVENLNNISFVKLKLIPIYTHTNFCLSVELEKPQRSEQVSVSKVGYDFDVNRNYISKFDEAFVKRQRQGRLQQNHISTHEKLRFPYDNETIYGRPESNSDQSAAAAPAISTTLNPRDLEVETVDLESNKTMESQQIAENVGLFAITKVDLGVSSQLLVYPGMEAHIDYEVTNMRENLLFYTIRVVDTKSFLRSVTPNSIYIRPGETIVVRLIVLIPQATKAGTVDDITLTLQGQNQVIQAAQLKVISRDEGQDRNPPYVTWSFGTRCENTYYNQRECSTKFWTLDVFAQDYETGLMRVSSTPNGIVPRTPFTVGTTEPVRSVYTSSCCEPRVTLMAYDLAGNQRTYTIDVRDIVLTEASIAAIVLGVILLILLIGALIGLIVWCCKKKRSRSRDLSFHVHPERVR